MKTPELDYLSGFCALSLCYELSQGFCMEGLSAMASSFAAFATRMEFRLLIYAR